MNDDSQGYHETITQAYVRGVRSFLSRLNPALPLCAKVNALPQVA